LPASQRLQQLAIQHLPALLMANTCRQEYENLPNPSTLLRDEPFFLPWTARPQTASPTPRFMP
ncbi:hypothetical protein, partial [Bordetella parapertussis]|uniref:hypothetical protein n=1 Tax=Bordetella parapertussis TaxID=519 RepID=UPI001C7085E0